MRIERIKGGVGKVFIREHHYTRSCHNGPMCWGLFSGDVLVGVIAFATPCSEAVRRSVFGEPHRVTELHRLCILDFPGRPQNAASWFIARAMKALHKERPDLWGVLSFADGSEGHTGTVYQSVNALYCGMTQGRAVFYRDGEGRLRHPRQNGVNITRAEALRRGWTPERRQQKHRYLLMVPGHKRSHVLRHLRLDVYPYPKGDT